MQEKENLIFYMNELRNTLERNLSEGFKNRTYLDLNHDLEYTKDSLKTYCISVSKECQKRKEELVVDMENLLKTINEISVGELDDNACDLLKTQLDQCTTSMVGYFELLNSIESSEKEEQIGV